MQLYKSKILLGSLPFLNAADIIFEDNFDFLDLSKWQHEITLAGGGNWEFQMYHNNRSNSYVHDNTLFIKPTLMADYTSAGESFLWTGQVDLWGGADADYCTNNDYYGCSRVGTGTNYLNPAISARIRTLQSFTFKYGKVTFQAKMPKGDWLWPAIWLMPAKNAYGGWPSSGEIDIVESRGNVRMECYGGRLDVSCISSNLHWGPRYEYNQYEKTGGEICKNDGTDFNTKFSEFEMEWTETYIQTKVDGEVIMRASPTEAGYSSFWDYGQFPGGLDNPWKYNSPMAPFDQEFYLIFNVAVGGTNGFFPDGCVNYGSGAKPWNNQSPTAPRDFWNAHNAWYDQTWDKYGENDALQIKNLKVYSYEN